MLGPSVEKLFLRYRAKGDAKALAEVFDRTAPELFRLAQHLVRDPLQAEDVLQETFVSAIDSAERWDAERPLVPWLTGILARQASMLRRKSRRVVEPDRLREREPADPAELVAESELSSALLGALRELPELYREVLHRHLLDGAKPAEIARDLGRAPGTVRMQLHRGLEQLRRALPASFAAGAALAAFSPRGLSAVREAVLAHGASVAAAAGVGVAGAKVATLALAKLAGIGALGLLLAVVAAIAWRVHALKVGEVPPRPALDARDSFEQGGPGPLASTVSQRESRQAREQEPPPPRQPRLRLVGSVLGVVPEQLGSTRIEVRGVARYRWPDEAALRATPSEDGAYQVDLDPLLALAAAKGPVSAISVRALLADHLVANELIDPAVAIPLADAEGGPPRFELRRDLTLRPAALVAGQVRGADGPLPGARVLLVRMLDGQPLSAEVDEARTDGEGQFVLQGGEPGEYGVLAFDEGWRPAFAPVLLAATRPVHLAPLVLEPGRTLRGAVTNAGLPVAGATLVLDFRDFTSLDAASVSLGGRWFAWTSGRFEWCILQGRSDANGRFAFEGLAWEDCFLQVLSIGDGVPLVRAPEFVKVSVGPQQDQVDLELGASWWVLAVTDEDGRLLPARANWTFGEPEAVATPSSAHRLEIALGPEVARDPQELAVLSAGFEPRLVAVRASRPAERIEQTVVLARSSEGGSLFLELSTAGAPLQDVTLRAEGEPTQTRKLAVEEGRVHVEGLPTGEVELELFANGAWSHYQDLLLPARLSLTLGAFPWELQTQAVAFERGGRLRLFVTDSAGLHLPARCGVRDLYGRELPVRFLLRGPDEQGFTTGEKLSDKGPSDVYPNLPAGVYEVELSMEGRETRVMPVRIELGETTELEVVLP